MVCSVHVIPCGVMVYTLYVCVSLVDALRTHVNSLLGRHLTHYAAIGANAAPIGLAVSRL